MPRTHLLMMLGSHLLLMMLRAHLLLMMLHLLIHRMLIHRMLPVSRTAVFSHLVVVYFSLVALEILLIAVKIFIPVPVVVGRVFVPVFFASHSCSLGMMFSARVSTCLFTFSCTGSSCGSNTLRAFALPVALIK